MKIKRIGSICIAVMLMLGGASFSSASDAYPNKPIQLICPFAPGGDSDLSARIVADKLQRILGQPVLIVNKPGAGSALGIDFVIGSKPDGYTILTSSAPMVFLPIIMPQAPFKMDDLVPVGRLATYNNVVAVSKNLPVKTMAEFIAYAKANPNTLSYSSPGVGTTGHFIGELINMETKLDLQHIPYPGVAPAVTALVGNHVQAAFISLSASLPHIKSGSIKALAVLAAKRDPEIPQVPTTVEEGFSNLIAPSYHIIYAPAKIPAAILEKLQAALEQALEDKEVRTKIEALSLNPSFLNSQDTRKFLDSEIKKWTPVARKANIVVK
jgi:tripartite-type tricarboxylate transporter receptor subunit TctC